MPPVLPRHTFGPLANVWLHFRAMADTGKQTGNGIGITFCRFLRVISTFGVNTCGKMSREHHGLFCRAMNVPISDHQSYYWLLFLSDYFVISSC